MVIAEEVIVADSFLKRLRGLMFTKKLAAGRAMYIYPCSAVHTFFMKYPIDVLYLDKNNKVLYMDEKLKPWVIGKYKRGVCSVIELTVGRIEEAGIKVGQVLKFK
jgi:uncharacterized membrane protein (UPF0127 family)